MNLVNRLVDSVCVSLKIDRTQRYISFTHYLADMNRRKFLLAAGGGIFVSGVAAGAKATRVDLLADSELTRGKGEAVAIERKITRDSVEYLESTNEVRDNGTTWEEFKKWARWECGGIGAREAVSVVDNRLDTSVEGVGSGVQALIFGLVITVDHNVVRDREGTIVSKPNITLDQLISVAPRTMTITVNLDGRGYTKDFPVGAGHHRIGHD